MSNENTPRSAVERYLNWLEDPESIIDKEAVEAARRRFLSESDPISRLHAAAEVAKVETADENAIVEAFITHARAYADSEGIPVAAFQALNVPDDVLERAGFSLAPTGRGRRRTRRRGQRPSVSAETLKATVAEMPEKFTLAQLADRAGGGSPGTVKKAIDELIAEGRAERLGPDPNHTGRGRAPTLYAKR